MHAQLYLSHIARVGCGAGSQSNGSGLVSHYKSLPFLTFKLNNDYIHSLRDNRIIYGYHSSTF